MLLSRQSCFLSGIVPFPCAQSQLHHSHRSADTDRRNVKKKSSLSVSQHERTEKNDAAVPSAHGKKREKTQLSSSAVYLHFSHVHRNFKGGREGEIYYATNVCSFAGKEEFRRIFFPSQCVSHVRAHDARDFIADHTFLIKNIAV